MAIMVLSNFGYSLREAGHHFRRNWSTAFGAVVTIFLSLFIIGLFVLASALIENMVGNVENRVTIQAFLSDDADQTAVDSFTKKVQGWDNVESVTYKSKEEALKEYKTTMSNRNAADAVAALDGQNPIPASLVIKIQSRLKNPLKRLPLPVILRPLRITRTILPATFSMVVRRLSVFLV